MSDNLNPNPRIKKIQVGTRTLRDITIYPFSAGQEIEVIDIVSVLINTMAETQAENKLKDLEVFEVFSKIIKEKSVEIIGFVTDPEDNVTLNDFDNNQFVDFVEILIDTNFGEHLKKRVNEIQEKVKILFLSPKSSPNSSEKQVTS
jgi:hypothetical protein